jgi:RNA polymerase sigma factor (TIGR02999 family)
VYPELHRIAQRYLKKERSGHTLQCTALINEAYLLLVQASKRDWNDRTHFFGFAARLMRNILVDYARARRTEKRGRATSAVTLSESDGFTPAPDVGILDLNLALEELEKLDSFQCRIVELRYFGGLSIEETAAITGVSVRSIKREWLVAKTWVRRRLMAGTSES